jgi:NADH dehydrogenase/NADH:ubiquinone oxidoreductase subunit G
MIGQFMDLEACLAFRDLLHRLNCENIDVKADNPHLNSDFRSQYLMNSRVTGIEDTDLLLLVGCNPRLENPVLNARIRKAFGVNGLEIAQIGSAPNAGYEFIHLGNSP